MVLQEEEEKVHPNEEVVMDLMKKTFYIRRRNILKAMTSVTNLLKIYPSLRNHSQVSTNVCYQGYIIENMPSVLHYVSKLSLLSISAYISRFTDYIHR